MPIKEGWEVPPDKRGKFEKLLSTDDVGEPILTSKCFRQGAYGFLIVSNKGISWINTQNIALSAVDAVFGSGQSVGKSSTWVRWHDVVTITPHRRPGLILVKVNNRKKGALLVDKRGITKTKVLQFFIRRNQLETKIHFKQRKAEFFGIMKELYSQYKTDANPPTSDSRI